VRVAVFGLGYVGCTAAACIASQGHSVVGIDVSSAKVDKINQGISPITEPGVDELIAEARAAGRISADVSPDGHLDDADIAIVCVGTPSGPDGSHNMGFIAQVSRTIAMAIKPDREKILTVAYRSTMRPGSIEEIIKPIFVSILGDAFERCVELAYNPEFLRESTAVKDYFNPPKIVVGTLDGKPSANMDALHEGIDAKVFHVGIRDAEFTKFVDNTFHALKAAFANEIGRVCVKLGVNVAAVHEIFVSDTRLNISKNYLRPGGAFGGSCLPKDVRALQYMAGQAHAQTFVIDSLINSNEAHKQFPFNRCVHGVPEGGKVLLLGIAFKKDSDDLRESPHVDLARMLIGAGYQLKVYDPYVKPGNLVGQNLGALSNSPFLWEMLCTREVAEGEHFDVVIDSWGTASQYALNTDRVVSTAVLA
jgi:GDP-mannose 6-dehydrogenase